jgi:hypothetical protein
MKILTPVIYSAVNFAPCIHRLSIWATKETESHNIRGKTLIEVQIDIHTRPMELVNADPQSFTSKGRQMEFENR